MSELWLGAPVTQAHCVFLLSNKPIMPVSERVTVTELIDLNGNHWRKILTIMAKLTAPKYADWRDFRDTALLDKVGVAFSIEQIESYEGVVFIVGNGFRDSLSIPDQATKLGGRHIAYYFNQSIWCPYLDYRQFPNVLIDELREHLPNLNMENACFKH